MELTFATSDRATKALKLIKALQQNFADQLKSIGKECKIKSEFSEITWARDGGKHGGGARLVATAEGLFNRGSVNVSQVQYEDLPQKPLSSATALSTIIHPANPHAPSVHMHFSWTELKTGKGSWRLMADLNPCLPNSGHWEKFAFTLKKLAPTVYDQARNQGDRYFYIPALQRHRGATHFYLENYDSGVFENDLQFVKSFAQGAIDQYCDILSEIVVSSPKPTSDEIDQQIAYHTLYFYQVLTLDRGTTSGLLVHNENDVGIMGSLPSRINRELLATWESQTGFPQDQLVKKLLQVLPSDTICQICDDIKVQLAQVVRSHYQQFPEGLKLQARGDTLPQTVANHT